MISDQFKMLYIEPRVRLVTSFKRQRVLALLLLMDISKCSVFIQKHVVFML
jgi:hypothetical protein